MFKTVTVDQALSKGQRMVNYPVFLIMISGFVACYYLTTIQAVSQWLAAAVALAGFIAAWLYWSFKITKWRIWAFEKVDDVYELKYRAIQEKLI